MLNFKFHKTLLLALTMTAASAAGAKEFPFSYLRSSSFNIAKDFNAVPQLDSEVTAEDIKTMMKFQISRSPADCARAESEVSVSVATFFGKPRGLLTELQVKTLDGFLEKVALDSKYFIKMAKDYFQRPRPYESFQEIEPCITKEKSYSFPSGHSALAYIWGDLLEEIIPLDKEKIHTRADQIALDRTIAGVHFPSDIAESRKFATKVIEKLKTLKNFTNDFEEVKNQFSKDQL